jgi:membrane protease YdiL (CAAX protease family)
VREQRSAQSERVNLQPRGSVTLNVGVSAETMVVSPRPLAAVLEISALTLLILSYIWGWQGTFHGAGPLMVTLYFGVGIAGHLYRQQSPRQIGFRLDNWIAASRNAGIAVAVASCLFLAIGAVLDTWHFPTLRQSLLVAPWMIVWGTAQQYGLICIIYQRLLEILQGHWAATIGAAFLFAIFHLPNPLLVAVTLVAGAVSCTLYRRVPNVIVLGIAHAAISFVLASALPASLTHRMHVGPGYFEFS